LAPPGSPSPESAEGAAPAAPAEDQDFEALLGQHLTRMDVTLEPGQLLRVPIVSTQGDDVLVDVGEKAEGVLKRTELLDLSGQALYRPGDLIDVVVRGQDPTTGLIRLSHTEARRRLTYQAIEAALAAGTPIRGRVTRAVKGGLIVEIGTTAFLPASQIDLRRVEDLEAWVGQQIECLVLEFSPANHRIILSRRKLLESRRQHTRAALLERLQVGDVVEGTVKRIVDFGVFVDLGDNVDGLIPRSEVSLNRAGRPEDYVQLGERVRVKVIEIDRETGKMTLSRRRAQPDPWEGVLARYPLGKEIEGEIVSLTGYGAFVRLEEGLDGMIHISDLAWDSAGRRPSDYVSVGQRLQAVILQIDAEKQRISLGVKQITTDPWEELEERYPAQTRIRGKVTGLTKYGAFVEIEPGIEGMIHVSDFSWAKRVNHPREVVRKGEEIEACVLAIDRQRRRIALGVKQLAENPLALFSARTKVGQSVQGTVINLTDFGVFLKLEEGVEGFIHVSQLDRNRVESPAALFKIGDSIEAEVTKIDLEAGKVSLSRRQLLKREEKEILRSYRSAGSGGSNLGELLAEIPFEDELSKD